MNYAGRRRHPLHVTGTDGTPFSPLKMASVCLPFLLRCKYILIFICFHFEHQLYVIAHVRQTKFHAEV